MEADLTIGTPRKIDVLNPTPRCRPLGALGGVRPADGMNGCGMAVTPGRVPTSSDCSGETVDGLRMTGGGGRIAEIVPPSTALPSTALPSAALPSAARLSIGAATLAAGGGVSGRELLSEGESDESGLPSRKRMGDPLPLRSSSSRIYAPPSPPLPPLRIGWLSEAFSL